MISTASPKVSFGAATVRPMAARKTMKPLAAQSEKSVGSMLVAGVAAVTLMAAPAFAGNDYPNLPNLPNPGQIANQAGALADKAGAKVDQFGGKADQLGGKADQLAGKADQFGAKVSKDAGRARDVLGNPSQAIQSGADSFQSSAQEPIDNIKAGVQSGFGIPEKIKDILPGNN